MKIVIQQLTAGSGTATVTAPSSFTFVAITNTTPADIKMAPGKAVVQPTDAFDYPAGTFIGFPLNEQQTSVTLFWSNAQAGNLVTVYFSDVPFFTPGNVGSVSVNVVTMPSVNISGGTVSLSAGTTVGISGTVTINGSVSVSNTPTVNINSTGNTVSLAANTSVSITGTVTVTGTVNIGNSPSVLISGTGNTVQLAANTSVNIGNTPNVNISSGTVNATITGSNVTLDSNVVNAVLPNTSTVRCIANASTTVSNLANGASIRVDGNAQSCGSPILADGFIFVAHSSSGYVYNQYTGSGGWTMGGWTGEPTGFSYVGNLDSYSGSVNAASDMTGIVLFSTPRVCNSVVLSLVNNTGATIVSDTITVTVWLIKAQVEISNTTSSPANMQAASGSFDTQSSYSGTVANNASAQTVTLVAAGNYIQTLILYIGAPTSSGVTYTPQLKNGSSTFYNNVIANDATQEMIFDFGEGVTNNGITMTIPGSSPQISYSGYAILRSATPRQRVATVV